MREKTLLRFNIQKYVMPLSIAVIVIMLLCRVTLGIGEVAEYSDKDVLIRNYYVYYLDSQFDSTYVLYALSFIFGYIIYSKTFNAGICNNVPRKSIYKTIVLCGALFTAVLTMIKIISVIIPYFLSNDIQINFANDLSDYYQFNTAFSDYQYGILSDERYGISVFISVFLNAILYFAAGASIRSLLTVSRNRVIKICILGAYAIVYMIYLTYKLENYSLILKLTENSPNIILFICISVQLIMIIIFNICLYVSNKVNEPQRTEAE